MKKIKYYALTLSACMALASFAGCTETKETSASSENSTEAAATSDISEETEETETSIETDSYSVDDTEVKLDEEGQEYANSFISGFAMQSFADYDRSSASTLQFLGFVRTYLKLNSPDLIIYETKGDVSYEVFYVDTAFAIVGQNFGYPLKTDECRSLPTPPDSSDNLSQGPFYENDKIWYPAADGETYNCIGIVNGIKNNADGTETLYFTLYEIEYSTYSGLDAKGIAAYYSLDSDEAASDSTLNQVATGSAIVGISQSGNYELISYHTAK